MLVAPTPSDYSEVKATRYPARKRFARMGFGPLGASHPVRPIAHHHTKQRCEGR